MGKLFQWACFSQDYRTGQLRKATHLRGDSVAGIKLVNYVNHLLSQLIFSALM